MQIKKISEFKYHYSASEKEIQRVIALDLKNAFGKTNVNTEVSTSLGRIDILTNKAIIELKKSKDFKDGIGQLLGYKHSYPNHKMVLYLFGKALPYKLKKELFGLAKRHNIYIYEHKYDTHIFIKYLIKYGIHSYFENKDNFCELPNNLLYMNKKELEELKEDSGLFRK